MKITVNGQAKETADNSSLHEVLIQNEVTNIEMVTVQLNGEFVAKEEYANTEVKNGDEVDFMYFMGGGSWSE